MEYYLWTASSYTVLKSYKQYLKAPLWERSTKFDGILDKCITRFVAWLIYHVSSIGTTGRQQMFYYTLMNEFFGLSRQGIDMCYKFGFGVSSDMFDNHKRLHHQRSVETITTKLQSPHVIWLDNFSKFKAHSIPTIRKDIFASCLHTGMTVNEYVQQLDDGKQNKVSMQVQLTEEKEVIPAMPDDLMSFSESVMPSIKQVYDMGTSYYSESLVLKYDINNIPLKIDVKVFPELKSEICSAKNSTAFIHPYQLMKPNIGSNRGLATILRQFQDDHRLHLHNACQQYKIMNLDENIYYRTLKVLLICCGCCL